jgi:hypothetical protein
LCFSNRDLQTYLYTLSWWVLMIFLILSP